jgi:iron complex outermembrane recepter protein
MIKSNSALVGTIRQLLVAAAFVGLSQAAGAQQAPNPAGPAGSGDNSDEKVAAASTKDERLEEVVVTGTRLEVSSFTSANMVSVVTAQDARDLGLVSVGDIVSQLPQNSNYVSGANVGAGNFNIGEQLADLRGLNPFFGTRTLTLVNGERVVPTTTGGAVDLNIIPSILVARTEIVTGGGSAAYGTDAVAGVVNIILDNKLEGFRAQVDGGQTVHNDGKNLHAAFAAGTKFADGHGHIIFGAEYADNQPIGNCAAVRLWCSAAYNEFTNSGYAGTPAGALFPGSPAVAPNGLPHYIIGPNSTQVSTTTGVLLNPFGPSYTFNNAGTAASGFDFGNPTLASGFPYVLSPDQGGSGAGSYDYLQMRPLVDHYSMLTHATYEFTDTIEGWFEASFSQRTAENNQPEQVSDQYIYGNNPFLPAGFAAANPGLFAGGIFGPPGAAIFNATVGNLSVTNDTLSGVLRSAFGLKGGIAGSWGWDGYYSYGQTQTHERLHNMAVSGGSLDNENQFLTWALDAVPGPNGTPACAATIQGNPNYTPAAVGCQPLNLIGAGNASPSSLAYVFRTEHEDTDYEQQVVSGAVHGNLSDGWGAGPIALAAGAEYRFDYAHVTHDLQDQPWYFQYALNYGGDYSGSIGVLEGFSEINVPILKDLSFAKNLSLDVAARETRNETTDGSDGSSNTQSFVTWKVGGVYDVNDWIRLRASRSLDTRAPGLYELFDKSVYSGGGFGTVTNPWTGASESIASEVGGAGPGGLKPETARTTTAGFVVTGHGALDGFAFSADWYQIYLDNSIAWVGAGAPGILLSCDSPAHALCNEIEGTPNGTGGFSTITGINNYNLNIASFIVRGTDFATNYHLPLNRIISTAKGSLNFRVTANWQYDMIYNPGLGLPTVNYAGQSGPSAAFGNFNTSPKWQGNAVLTYDNGPFTGTVQLHYIGSGTYAVTNTTFSAVTPDALIVGPGQPGYSTTNPNSISNNSVASAAYVNLAVSYNFDNGMSVFASIDNLFNKIPPVAPGGNGYPTNPVYFDTYGATWNVGIRMKL